MREIRLFGHYLNLPLLLLSVMDVVVVGVVFYAAAIQTGVESTEKLMVLAGVGAFGIVLTKTAVGLYNFQLRIGLAGILLRLGVAFLLGLPLVAVAGMLLPITRDTLFTALLAGGFSYACLGLLHAGFFALADAGMLRRRIIVLGAGDSALKLLNLRRRSDRRGFEIVGFVPVEEVNPAASPLIRPDRSLCQFSKALRIDEIVVALEERRNVLPMGELVACRFQGLRVIDLSNFIERETGKMRLELLRPGWLVFDGNRTGRLQDGMKRMLDIVSAVVLLITSLPVTLATVLAIKREDGLGAPWLYRQARVGKDGKVFELIKFRSMRTDAEQDGRARWASRDDARVTRVGRIIRKMRIDEIPQLWNVICGHMSMVGPRPERPEFVAELEHTIPYYGERHRIKPGVTGWAQVLYPYGASHEDAREKLAYDLYYLKNRSILLDSIIIIQTVEVVLFGKGAR